MQAEGSYSTEFPILKQTLKSLCWQEEADLLNCIAVFLYLSFILRTGFVNFPLFVLQFPNNQKSIIICHMRKSF